MLDKAVEYLDGEFEVIESQPSLISEVSALIGEDGVVTQAVNNLYYRNKYPRVYDAVSKAVVEAGFKKAEKSRETKKDGTEKINYVSDMEHLRAYLATGDEARQSLQALFEKHGAEQPLYVKGERIGGGGKISQSALDAANNYLAMGDDVVERVVTGIETEIGGTFKIGRDSEGSVTPESLARGIQTLNKVMEARAKAATKNTLAALAKAAA